jgi:hypothetical protein
MKNWSVIRKASPTFSARCCSRQYKKAALDEARIPQAVPFTGVPLALHHKKLYFGHLF